MDNYKEIDGDLVKLGIKGSFDVLVQGNNCFCVQGAGLAPQFVKAFNTDKFVLEHEIFKGDINKLGTIDYEYRATYSLKRTPRPTMEGHKKGVHFAVVNAYTQYGFGSNHTEGTEQPLDYEALTLCMRKINHIFKGKHIGLPKIGCGLGGASWDIVKPIVIKELKDCLVTVVIYSPQK